MIHDLQALTRALGSRQRLELPVAKLGRAAVLLCLYGPGPDYQVLYTVRTSRVEHHKGQISFPGGASDPGDKDIIDTALRETLEEIGVQKSHVSVLGLSDDMVTSSQFTVTPVVARIEGSHPYPFALHEMEVETLLAVPLSHLSDTKNVISPVQRTDGSAPGSYQFGEHVIFGATARMTATFLNVVSGLRV